MRLVLVSWKYEKMDHNTQLLLRKTSGPITSAFDSLRGTYLINNGIFDEAFDGLDEKIRENGPRSITIRKNN
jgi:hypothetical protein